MNIGRTGREEEREEEIDQIEGKKEEKGKKRRGQKIDLKRKSIVYNIIYNNSII